MFSLLLFIINLLEFLLLLLIDKVGVFGLLLFVDIFFFELERLVLFLKDFFFI